MEERICKYRNCDLEITHKRPQALYCSRKHKTYEGIYRSREHKKTTLRLTVQDNSDIKE